MNTVTDALNQLLLEAQRSLAPRLLEATVFVSSLSVPEVALVQRMVQASRVHCAQLAELIVELGGYPWPRSAKIDTGHLHFQELHHALSHLEVDLTRLIGYYSDAVECVAGEPKAAALVTRIRQEHEQNLSAIRKRLETNVVA